MATPTPTVSPSPSPGPAQGVLEESAPTFIVTTTLSMIASLTLIAVTVLSKEARRGHTAKIILLVTICDFVFAAKFWLTAVLWVAGFKDPSLSFRVIPDKCKVSAAVEHFAGSCSCLWNAAFAFDFLAILKNPLRSTRSLMKYYHLAIWPGVIATTVWTTAVHFRTDPETCMLLKPASVTDLLLVYPVYAGWLLGGASLLFAAFRLLFQGTRAARAARCRLFGRHTVYSLVFLTTWWWLILALSGVMQTHAQAVVLTKLEAIFGGGGSFLLSSIRLAELWWAGELTRVVSTYFTCSNRCSAAIADGSLGSSDGGSSCCSSCLRFATCRRRGSVADRKLSTAAAAAKLGLLLNSAAKRGAASKGAGLNGSSGDGRHDSRVPLLLDSPAAVTTESSFASVSSSGSSRVDAAPAVIRNAVLTVSTLPAGSLAAVAAAAAAAAAATRRDAGAAASGDGSGSSPRADVDVELAESAADDEQRGQRVTIKAVRAEAGLEADLIGAVMKAAAGDHSAFAALAASGNRPAMPGAIAERSGSGSGLHLSGSSLRLAAQVLLDRGTAPPSRDGSTLLSSGGGGNAVAAATATASSRGTSRSFAAAAQSRSSSSIAPVDGDGDGGAAAASASATAAGVDAAAAAAAASGGLIPGFGDTDSAFDSYSSVEGVAVPIMSIEEEAMGSGTGSGGRTGSMAVARGVAVWDLSATLRLEASMCLLSALCQGVLIATAREMYAFAMEEVEGGGSSDPGPSPALPSAAMGAFGASAAAALAERTPAGSDVGPDDALLTPAASGSSYRLLPARPSSSGGASSRPSVSVSAAAFVAGASIPAAERSWAHAGGNGTGKGNGTGAFSSASRASRERLLPYSAKASFAALRSTSTAERSALGLAALAAAAEEAAAGPSPRQRALLGVRVATAASSKHRSKSSSQRPESQSSSHEHGRSSGSRDRDRQRGTRAGPKRGRDGLRAAAKAAAAAARGAVSTLAAWELPERGGVRSRLAVVEDINVKQFLRRVLQDLHAVDAAAAGADAAALPVAGADDGASDAGTVASAASGQTKASRGRGTGAAPSVVVAPGGAADASRPAFSRRSASAGGRRAGGANGSGSGSGLIDRARLVSYAEATFAALRRAAGITPQHVVSVLDPLLLRHGYISASFSTGASSSFFARSVDGSLIVKTVDDGEMAELLALLPAYTAHLAAHPDSLLCRFYGAFRLSMPSLPDLQFVLMGNAFPILDPGKDALMYDLKGSWLGRRAKPDARVLMDQDLAARFPRGITPVPLSQFVGGAGGGAASAGTPAADAPMLPLPAPFAASLLGAPAPSMPMPALTPLAMGRNDSTASVSRSVSVSADAPSAASLAAAAQAQASITARLRAQIARDARFLTRAGIMDYSLILLLSPVDVSVGGASDGTAGMQAATAPAFESASASASAAGGTASACAAAAGVAAASKLRVTVFSEDVAATASTGGDAAGASSAHTFAFTAAGGSTVSSTLIAPAGAGAGGAAAGVEGAGGADGAASNLLLDFAGIDATAAAAAADVLPLAASAGAAGAGAANASPSGSGTVPASGAGAGAASSSTSAAAAATRDGGYRLLLSMRNQVGLGAREAIALTGAAQAFPAAARQASSGAAVGPWSPLAVQLVSAPHHALSGRSFASAAHAADAADAAGSGAATGSTTWLAQLGVIDMLQAFNLRKRLERAAKTAIYALRSGHCGAFTTISSVDPATYGTRFDDMVARVLREQ